LRAWLNGLGKVLIDDAKNQKILGISVYSVLGIVSLVMTIMNIFTHKGMLTLATAVFAVLCAINLFLTFSGTRGISIAKAIFSVEILVLFTFFLISGNPEGFSAIWICMLPSVGMLFFGRGRGSILCGVMLIILVLLLWTDAGNTLLQYPYTDSFQMRFPVLFVAFHVLALFLETVRVATMKEMNRLQKLYHELSVKDPLTHAVNRQGMYFELETDKRYASAKKLGVVMFDLDNFKTINDTYGHNAGDHVLCSFSDILRSRLDALICRWGGEEFVAIYTDDHVTGETLRDLKDTVEQMQLSFEGSEIRFTTSLGVYETSEIDLTEIDQMIEYADHALYQAKDAGRNRIVYFDHAAMGQMALDISNPIC